MKEITLLLPDSIEFSQEEIQALVLEKAANNASPAATAADVSLLLGRPVSPEEAADIRHLIGLYYAERATRLVDQLWDEQGWTAATMHEWLGQHLRTAHGRPAA